VVVGITRQNEAIGQGFDVLKRRLCHARRAPQHEEGVGRWTDRDQEEPITPPA
jgi:hypothetical protein